MASVEVEAGAVVPGQVSASTRAATTWTLQRCTTHDLKFHIDLS